MSNGLSPSDPKKSDGSDRPSAGRPTREQAERRHEALLDNALAIFLDRGFELATIDTIAASVGMTKRTVYARYDDKSALFRATVKRAVERWALPIEKLRALETDNLESTLAAIARIRMENFVSAAGQRLQHVIRAEAYRFPEIQLLFYDLATWPAIRYLADLFARRASTGELVAEEPELLATAFLTLVVGGPARGIVHGTMPDEAEATRRIDFYVGLFLNGVRPR